MCAAKAERSHVIEMWGFLASRTTPEQYRNHCVQRPPEGQNFTIKSGERTHQ